MRKSGVYGKIVSFADRTISVDESISRTILFSLSHNPEFSNNEHFDETYRHLLDKLEKGGYVKSYLIDEKYEKYLKDMRDILDDKSKFAAKYKEVISGTPRRPNVLV